MTDIADQRRTWMDNLEDDDAATLKAGLSDRQRRSFRHHWHLQAHPGQLPPKGDWSTWLVMAGRGFGKTRAGAEWVRRIAESDGRARLALVAASLGEARSVMVEGPSGILATARPGHRPRFEPSKNRLRWPTGAEAVLFSAAEPETLRGPQHSHAWCDELGKWPASGGRAEAAWDNLQLGLRLGTDPRTLVTTTPRSTALVHRLVTDEATVVTRGRSDDNKRHLAPGFLAAMRRNYGDSAFGRQELDGELLADVEGALWTRAMLEAARTPRPASPFARVVIGVDPPASAHGDECGIVVCARCEDGALAVLADCSVPRPSPERWARAVAEAARQWNADRVVAEANQGGAMVKSVLHAADIALPVKLVHASRGKAARAEPVAALYEAGRVHHAGLFAKLEDQLCGLVTGGGYEGPGRSPDRADALVWAVSELVLSEIAQPRITRFS